MSSIACSSSIRSLLILLKRTTTTPPKAAEFAGLRHTCCENPRRHRWAPHVERAWPDLMKRYHRMRASFTQIERLARRKAARLKREMADNPVNIINPLAAIVRTIACTLEAFSHLVQYGSAHRSTAKAAGGSHARGPPLIPLDCRLPIVSEAPLLRPQTLIPARSPSP